MTPALVKVARSISIVAERIISFPLISVTIATLTSGYVFFIIKKVNQYFKERKGFQALVIIALGHHFQIIRFVIITSITVIFLYLYVGLRYHNANVSNILNCASFLLSF
jgi:hypothetical protein